MLNYRLINDRKKPYKSFLSHVTSAILLLYQDKNILNRLFIIKLTNMGIDYLVTSISRDPMKNDRISVIMSSWPPYIQNMRKLYENVCCEIALDLLFYLSKVIV